MCSIAGGLIDNTYWRFSNTEDFMSTLIIIELSLLNTWLELQYWINEVEHPCWPLLYMVCLFVNLLWCKECSMVIGISTAYQWYLQAAGHVVPLHLGTLSLVQRRGIACGLLSMVSWLWVRVTMLGLKNGVDRGLGWSTYRGGKSSALHGLPLDDGKCQMGSNSMDLLG